MEFETWAANYNVEPPANGNDWARYHDNRYIHSICLYDQFTDELRSGYQQKYGGGGDKNGAFVQRTSDPVCGVTSQDSPGTLLGFWSPYPGESDTSKYGGRSSSGPPM